MRIAITTTRFNPAGLAALTENRAEVRAIDQEASPHAIETLLRDFDPHALISRGVAVTESAIAAAPSLRVIAKTGVGVDNIDIDAATARGIVVLSNVGANSRSVAEHSLALIFALARNVARHDGLMRAGIWSRFTFTAHELHGKHLGLVGFGQSAQCLASLAEALGMSVSVYAPRYRHGAPWGSVRRANSLTDLLAGVDIVSLHCPLTDETRGLINAEAIAALRQGAWIVNTARGQLIDEQALLGGLKSGQVGGAALDVHANEPMPAVHPLFAMENVVLTPHVAGTTIQSAARGHEAVARNVVAVLGGRPFDMRTIVNPQALERISQGSRISR